MDSVMSHPASFAETPELKLEWALPSELVIDNRRTATDPIPASAFFYE